MMTLTNSVPTQQRREACDQLFNEGGLVDQAMSDPMVQAEIRDGLPTREAVIQWLDFNHCDMSPWYTLLSLARGNPVRFPDLVFEVHRDGTVDAL